VGGGGRLDVERRTWTQATAVIRQATAVILSLSKDLGLIPLSRSFDKLRMTEERSGITTSIVHKV